MSVHPRDTRRKLFKVLRKGFMIKGVRDEKSVKFGAHFAHSDHVLLDRINGLRKLHHELLQPLFWKRLKRDCLRCHQHVTAAVMRLATYHKSNSGKIQAQRNR